MGLNMDRTFCMDVGRCVFTATCDRHISAVRDYLKRIPESHPAHARAERLSVTQTFLPEPPDARCTMYSPREDPTP